jgi:uncharacterized protein YeaO (DUF488 family)
VAIRIVRLGSERAPDEGPRIGTVRRPPRGVPRAEFARRNWYDAWYPNLAPSVVAMKLGQAAGSAARHRQRPNSPSRCASSAASARELTLSLR